MTIEEKYIDEIEDLVEVSGGFHKTSKISDILKAYFLERVNSKSRYNLEVHRYNSEITRTEFHRYPEGLWVKHDELIA